MGKVLYRTVLTHIHRGAFSPPLANCPVFIKMKEITFTFPYSWQVSATITITDSNQYLISVLSGVALGADLNLRRYGDARNWWMCTHPISGLFNSRGLLAKIVAKVTKVLKIVAKVSSRNYALILKKTPPPRAHTQNMEKVKDYVRCCTRGSQPVCKKSKDFPSDLAIFTNWPPFPYKACSMSQNRRFKKQAHEHRFDLKLSKNSPKEIL